MMYEFVLMYCTFLFWSIFAHEIGHFVYFKRVLNKDVEIRFLKEHGDYCLYTGKETDYKGIKPKHLKGIYEAGILFGTIPLFISLLYNGWLFIALAPVYYIGIRGDLEKWRSSHSQDIKQTKKKS